MTFAEGYKQLNTAQKEAVDTIDGPVLVIAGPGTGKTQLLALRAANILAKTDTQPQNILCLTYTEVGARNMRERLTKLIGQDAYDIRISTYHGFGSDIIRQYGEYFVDASAEKPIDKLGQDAILQEIFKTLPASNPLWRADIYLKDALGFISECKRAQLSPNDIRAIAASNESFISTASEITKQTIPVFARMNKEVGLTFVELLNNIRHLAKAEALPEDIAPLSKMCLEDLIAAVEFYSETGKTNELTAFKNKWLEKNADNQWVMGGMYNVKKMRGGADIYEHYLAALKQKGMYDYDDMITKAIKGLQQNDELRYSLHEQYLYVMLDEFQDTNRSQLKLVELLTNNPVQEGRANILAVGDDDQAIFSFQGAEHANMARFVSLYKDVKIITLTDNYRSHGDILHTAFSVANQIEERLSHALKTGDKVLAAKNANIPNAVVSRQNFKSDIAQFDWVANQITKLIQQGTPAQEIAVIAPQHKYLEPLVPYLQALDIPVRYDKRENVLEDQHILELVRMAELIMALSQNSHGTADSLWPAVLSSDYWQLPTSTIWNLSWQNYEDKTTHWQALMMQDSTLKPIALFFARLSQIVSNETLESLFDYIVGVRPLTLNEPDLAEYASPYYEYYFGKKSQAETPQTFTHVLSNLTVLRQKIREYRQDAERPLMLQDLLDFVADYQNANEKLLNTSPYHSADNAVQLMTAYGSKGLEFDVVFVLAVHDEVWGMKARGKNNIITLPQNLSVIRYAGSTKDEKKRLFYVAITRAKHSLYLTSYSQNYAGKATEALEFLNESEGKALALPAHTQTVAFNDTEAPALEALQHFWTTRHADGAQTASLRELVLPRLETFQLSATHVNTFTNVVFGGPQEFFLKTILKFPQAPTSDGQYGNAIHETLEAMQHTLRRTGELPDIDQAIAIFTTQLKSKRLSDAEFTRQNERGAIALADFIPWWWHNFTPEAQSEYDFRQEGSFVGDAHLSGKLDQLLIDNEDKTIRVVDFKTGKPHNKWTNEPKLHNNRQQLLFYKLLIENSHSFKGYDVNEAKLVFVGADTNGNNAELPISYKKDELERMEKLVIAVWHRIKNLDLPDISGYSKDLKGITEFEDWLIANDK